MVAVKRTVLVVLCSVMLLPFAKAQSGDPNLEAPPPRGR